MVPRQHLVLAPLPVDERRVEDAVEEMTRFVLAHLTTPRRDGSRPAPREAGARAATLIAPDQETLIRANEIWHRYRLYCGGDPFLGRRLRALLNEAGFARAIGTASSETWGTPELTRPMMAVLKDEFTGPKISETAIREGWADQAQMDGAARALDGWDT